MRNRLELRLRESRDCSAAYVSRQRLAFRKEDNWFRGMRRFVASNELFYSFEQRRLAENRFRPFSVYYDLGDRFLWNSYLQVRPYEIRLLEDNWDHAYLMGFGLRKEVDGSDRDDC